MTKRVAQTLTRLAGIDQDKTCAELAKQDRKTLLNFASGYPVKVSKLGSMKSAMVSSGGVSLKGVTAGTMASKLVEGLFFAGEVLDVDGDSGGYNIQWAFSSGRLAALSAMKYIEEKQHTG
ncbi:3-Dehydro-bile acid delta(4,6)-reductase-like protein [Aduncisulcus paluster]|uniref:3-Dehydro-bile acid delta(4,6)-reductase-like protein n=1 Tax=Aduncisulcus paluster TaxID=2918883 RepID=A0ABQ5JX79_9EUKA|nr:3-Dehydro-bile acid delta(4,6)-reductase-like protein [Aduncisulcus paluster]